MRCHLPLIFLLACDEYGMAAGLKDTSSVTVDKGLSFVDLDPAYGPLDGGTSILVTGTGFSDELSDGRSRSHASHAVIGELAVDHVNFPHASLLSILCSMMVLRPWRLAKNSAWSATDNNWCSSTFLSIIQQQKPILRWWWFRRKNSHQSTKKTSHPMRMSQSSKLERNHPHCWPAANQSM